MRPQDVIAAKRDGLALSDDQITGFIQGVANDSIGEAQIAAFAMAVYLKGMTSDERVALTRAMQNSGTTLNWDLPGPVVDKHSTGGVGDTVSLALAPALAACGAYVPMISGRGLGHTGGTLDKFDAIPGYQSTPDAETLQRVVRDVGCAIVGQTDDIAPADRRIYAVRDVTATVESLDLICASILSKKLAAGLDALVLDVKTGSGAFMTDEGDAKDLAKVLTDVANGAGCRTSALITDMNEPLMSAAGNAIEVRALVKLLTGDAVDARLWDVTVALGGEALHLGGIAEDAKDGAARIAEALRSGAAAERFQAMVTALGGPKDLLARVDDRTAQAPVVHEVTVDQTGFIEAVDTRALGVAVVELGGGRHQPSDRIDPAVGLDWILGRAMSVDPETPLARVHAATPEAAEAAAARIRAAYTIGEMAPDDLELIKARIT